MWIWARFPNEITKLETIHGIRQRKQRAAILTRWFRVPSLHMSRVWVIFRRQPWHSSFQRSRRIRTASLVQGHAPGTTGDTQSSRRHGSSRRLNLVAKTKQFNTHIIGARGGIHCGKECGSRGTLRPRRVKGVLRLRKKRLIWKK